MRIRLFRQCAQRGRSLARALRQRLLAATKPAEQAVVTGTLTDLVRSPPALVAENAFPRQQLPVILRGDPMGARCVAINRIAAPSAPTACLP
jgi:hypothetical protein